MPFMVGDGREESPLGLADGAVTTTKLADGAVTAAKIDTTGATSGQVLKVGSPAHWADDGLALPYEGSGGNSAGGALKVTNPASGSSACGVEAYGRTVGGFFKASDLSGFAYVGYGNRGIQASGNNAGGYFTDANGSGRAFVGYGDVGIQASGDHLAGSFWGDVWAEGELFWSPNVEKYRLGTSSTEENCTSWATHTFCALSLVSLTNMQNSNRSAYCYVLNDGRGRWRVCARGNSATHAECEMSCF